MTDLLEWTEELLDRELELRRAWAGRDPEYRTAVTDSRRGSFLSHKEAPTGRGWAEMRRPGPFTARARRSKEPSAIALQADRILTEARRRSLAKLEWFDDAELGPVLAATVTSEHLNLQGTPSARWWVAELGDGPRVVRIDRICPSCRGTGGEHGTGCGARLEATGQVCDAGWFSDGGLELRLGPRSRVERPTTIDDPRWTEFLQR